MESARRQILDVGLVHGAAAWRGFGGQRLVMAQGRTIRIIDTRMILTMGIVRWAIFLHALPQLIHGPPHESHHLAPVGEIVEATYEIGIEFRMIKHKGPRRPCNAP